MNENISFVDRQGYEQYEPTDSTSNCSDEEIELLTNVSDGLRRDEGSVKELLAFGGSDDELMNASDIEDAEHDSDPDLMNWGNQKRNYYNTDFIDQDYATYNYQEEELAKAEEKEARKIQLRLANQMTEADFALDSVEFQASAEEQPNEVNKNFSAMSKRERQHLFFKDSPEFYGLTKDFQDYLKEVDQLISPVLTYAKNNDLPVIPALEFSQLYENILMTYCSNVTFYLLLKANQVSVKNHPIINRLIQVKQLLQELHDKFENLIKPQLKVLLERQLPIEESLKTNINKSQKNKLSILDKYEADENCSGIQRKSSNSSNDESHGEEGQLLNDDMNDRRGVTFQIAKNKGLTPHRKKELRNPRVKHRGKYRKALLRRKGGVRSVRNETTRYGGEISGIKASVSKSIKLKS